jgi:hypothetical protein
VSTATLNGHEPDTAPPTFDRPVEYPCEVCGEEAGPYVGRGPKPKRCLKDKAQPKTKTAAPGRVTGKDASVAAQATQVLIQLNGMAAIGMMAMGLHRTASAFAGANDNFEAQAYAALTTDPDLCRLILKGGVKSAKISLAMAYVGLGMAAVPVAVEEIREKKAAREAALAEQEAE